jgi:hypothetical protein
MARALEVARLMNASASEAWRLLVDTRRWPEWGPSIRAVECPTRFIGPGSRGRVRTAIGLWFWFEVVEFEEGRRWSWRVGGVPATGHRVEPLGARRCRVVFEVPAPAWPYAVVCRRALRRIERALADAPPDAEPR